MNWKQNENSADFLAEERISDEKKTCWPRCYRLQKSVKVILPCNKLVGFCPFEY